MLQKWEHIKVFRADLSQPHDKYCICIDWHERWFMYFNSEWPFFRKACELAVSVHAHEVHGLRKISFVDTTIIIDDLPEGSLGEAINDPSRCLGLLAPFIIDRIKAAVATHGVLRDEQKAKILE